MSTAAGALWTDLMSMDVTWQDKVIRTVAVYLVIAVILRVSGKRTLAQWSSFDLVVVLLLSNVVQNAIIGPDNSLLGGILGAVVLVAFNAVVDRLAFLGDRAEAVLEGTATTLVRDGRFDEEAIRRIGLRDHELRTAMHEQGADSVEEVELAQLQPGGTFTVRLRPEARSATVGDLQRSIAALQLHLDERLAALEASPRLEDPGSTGR